MRLQIPGETIQMTGNNIDIDGLSEDELIALNYRVVERLKYLESYQTHQEMMRFSPGSKVSFQSKGGKTQIGTLVKFNKKTVTLITEAGQKWNVSPHLLNLVKEVTESGDNNRPSNIINIPRKD